MDDHSHMKPDTVRDRLLEEGSGETAGAEQTAQETLKQMKHISKLI